MPTVVVEYTGTQTGTEVAPANAVSVIVESQAKGGVGGTANPFTLGGGGGGAGGYSKDNSRAVAPGDQCAYNCNAAAGATVNTGTGGFTGIGQAPLKGVDAGLAAGAAGGTASGGTNTNTTGGSGNSQCCATGGNGGIGIMDGGGVSNGDGGRGGDAPSGAGTSPGNNGKIRFTYTTVTSIPNKSIKRNFAVTRSNTY